jgi:hypothetical protein
MPRWSEAFAFARSPREMFRAALRAFNGRRRTFAGLMRRVRPLMNRKAPLAGSHPHSEVDLAIIEFWRYIKRAVYRNPVERFLLPTSAEHCTASAR